MNLCNADYHWSVRTRALAFFSLMAPIWEDNQQTPEDRSGSSALTPGPELLLPTRPRQEPCPALDRSGSRLLNQLNLPSKSHSDTNTGSSLQVNSNCIHFICARTWYTAMSQHGLIPPRLKGMLGQQLGFAGLHFFFFLSTCVLSSRIIADSQNCMALCASVSDRRIKLVIRNHFGGCKCSLSPDNV